MIGDNERGEGIIVVGDCRVCLGVWGVMISVDCVCVIVFVSLCCCWWSCITGCECLCVCAHALTRVFGGCMCMYVIEYV